MIPALSTTDVVRLLREGTAVTWAYADVSEDREDPQRLASSRRTSAVEALTRAGAPQQDAEVVADALIEPPGVAAPVSRFLVAQEGAVVVDEILPGPPKLPDTLGHGPVLDVLPLLAHRPLDVAFLVVEVGKGGGGFRVYRFGHEGVDEEQHVQGRTDTLHLSPSGGWDSLRVQHHVEELWRQNLKEVATAIDDAVRRTRARLVVVAGDIQARQLLAEQLAPATVPLLSMVDADTRASDALVEQVDIALARLLATRVHDALDLLRTHLNRGDATAASRLGEVVTALGAAQVDTLLIDPQALGDRTLLALGDVPWVATSPEEALGAAVLGEAPAAPALVRAAVLTDAAVVLASAGSMPGDSGVGALLRWPIGPATPSAGGTA
ncbi:Vms1/Ankzf1 family peptidyl-tRNA hydrolase [Frondihabitans peucedani]|uniref:Vms1/Ankzf1 family peptidyl-tRNA hydrolase n=1 Tax=Frondihabitans peucedani TaxID=598626 RepID=A0ABP8DZA4_9MICO